MSIQFRSQFPACLVAALGLYLIVWSIGYLIACLIALFIAKNCFCNCGLIAIQLLYCCLINALAQLARVCYVQFSMSIVSLFS